MAKTAWSQAKRFIKGKVMRHLPGMMTCVEFEDFIISYLDETLSESERKKFEFHIRFCRECREYLAAYKRTIEIGRATVRDAYADIPDDVPEDLVKAILKARQR